MAVREPRRPLTATERIVADRVRRARAGQPRRDPQGYYHTAIADLAKLSGIDIEWLLDLWDEQVSIRAYRGETGADAERAAYDEVTAIAAMGGS